jgi:hypothetical protein
MALITVTVCEFLGLRSGVTEVSILQGYHASLVGNLFQTFRDSFIFSFSLVKICFEDEISKLSQNVESQ